MNKFETFFSNVDIYRLKRKSLAFVVSFVRYIFLFTVGFVVIYPLLDKISTSFTAFEELGNPMSVYIPLKFSTEAYWIANNSLDFAKTITITLGYTSLMTALQIMSSAVIGYGFARFKFRGNNILFALVILTIIIPPESLLIPEYLSMRYFDIFGLISLTTGSTINLFGQPLVLVIKAVLGVGLRGGLFIFIFRQFFLTMPKELEEAGMVDGASVIQVFRKIMLPSSMPAIMTVGVFGFIWNYSDTTLSTFISKNILFAQRLLSDLMIDDIKNGYMLYENVNRSDGINPLALMAVQDAALLIFLLPLLILFFIIQRKFVENFERAGIVG